MFKFVIVLLAIFASASAFAPRFARVSRAAALNMSDMEMVKSVNGVETCEKRKVDKNGRCPGEAGYYPPNNAAPKDFAEFQREMAAKKAAAKK